MMEDKILEKQAQNNSIDNFKYAFDEAFLNKIIERMEQNEDIVGKIIDNLSFREIVQNWMRGEVYNKFNESKK
ncbi:MAG: hypothetical protein ACLFQV_09020 [Vulcanimicrobiota bacterium]